MSAFDPKRTLERSTRLTPLRMRSSLGRNMDQNPFPSWFPFLAIAWIVFVIGASIVFRRSRGKPVFPTVPPDAVYVDKQASGRWASNCLLVAVTDKALYVVPKFPFNLMFLPEVYGLERTIPLRNIRDVRWLRGFGLGNNVAVDHGEAELRLKVRNPQAFLDALAQSSVHVSA